MYKRKAELQTEIWEFSTKSKGEVKWLRIKNAVRKEESQGKSRHQNFNSNGRIHKSGWGPERTLRKEKGSET